MNTRRLAKRLTSGIALVSFAALASCVPPENTGTKTPDKTPPPDQTPQVVDEDIALGAFDPVELTGMVFKPEAFGNPNMVRVSSKKPTTLAKQRKKYAGTQGADKATEAQILVTLLWDEGKGKSDAEVAALRGEAKQLLSDLKAADAANFDPILYRMLFTLYVWDGDEANAVAVGTEMVANHAGNSITDALAPWIAYYQLRANQVEDAKKTVANWTLAQLAPNSDYLRAYAMAWTAFRAGDLDTAKNAIVWAASNWKSPTSVPIVVQDLLLMLSRGGTPIDEVMGYFASLSNGNADAQFEWLYKLYEGYDFAGYPKLAAAALQKALDVKGGLVQPMHVVGMNQRQFNSLLMAHEPEAAAAKLLDAYNGIGACGQPCAASTDAMATQIQQLAQHFHTTFATTQDESYYGPAEKLYNFYVNLGRPDSAKMQSNLTSLQETKKRMQPNSGRHDNVTMAWSLGVRNNAVKACYEQVLQAEPALAGELTLSLEVATDGSVSGATTTPPVGAEGLAAVGTCVTARARTWAFPGRTKPGKTTLSRVYKFAPQQ